MSAFGEWRLEATAGALGVRLWMAGDYDQAKQVLREHCEANGACFSISPTHYIYSGGEEAGFCINLINYARFPKTMTELTHDAEQIALRLLRRLNQSSYTIEQYNCIEPQTFFYSRRKD